MNKYEQFLEFFDYLVANCKEEVNIPDEVKEVYDTLTSMNEKEKDKPLFSENGLKIFKYLREHPELKNLKSKDISEGMNISSRSVSGAMRKLVADGYVEKFGKNPIVYNLTDKGKNFNIEGE